LKKTLRYIVRVTAFIGGLLLLAWLLLVSIISLKKPALLKRVSAELKDRTGTEVSIGNMDISFFRHFPYVTLQLSKVTLHDSLWQQHHHDLLKAESLDLRFSLPGSLFSGKPRVSKVFLEGGSIYLFTDSTGYTNTEMLRKGGSAGSDKEMKWPEFSLTDINFVMEKQDKRKLFDLDIRRLIGSVEKNNRTLLLDLSIDLTVNSFAFNTEKGSFLKEKPVSGHFRLQFNSGSKILQVNKQSLLIDGHPFLLSGRFFPEVSPDPFLLTVQTSAIPYKKATALLTPNIQQKLDQYDIDKPVSLNAIIDAGSADDPTPLINVRMSLSKGSVSTPIGRFTETSFEGSFTNEWVHGHKREDENSAVRFLSFSGAWSEISLKADTITITNLKHPLLATDLHSKFELAKLNELTGSKTIQFQKGMGNLNISYKGPLSGSDSTAVSINGGLNIDSASMDYLPYRFLLTDCKGKIRFRDQDLLIDHLEAHAGGSKLWVKGIARNLVSLLDRNPENVSMDWTLTSPRLDLRDFTAVLGKPVEPTPPPKADKTSKSPFGTPGSRLDHFLREGDLHLQLEAADLLYRKFSGAHAKADLLFSGKEIKLTHMEIEQGNGSLSLSGSLRRQETTQSSQPQRSEGNPLSLQSHIEQADLPTVFAAFNNFGQQALLDKNLKGTLTADIQLTGQLTDKAVLIQNSLKGAVNFSVKGGQLLDFDPMEKIQVAVLKKRDLSEIHFSELKSQLDLDTTTLTIHRMEIQSTAFTLFAEGTYDWKTGADMSLQIPLSNLKKDRNPDLPPANKGTGSKTGVSLRLRAKTGDDGKLKISWDPFKKALKKAPRAPGPTARSKGREQGGARNEAPTKFSHH